MGNVISRVRRIEGTERVSIDINDNEFYVVLSDVARNKFMLYLRSIITSIKAYNGGDYSNIERAYVNPKTRSLRNVILPCKCDISMIGYKDEEYILLKFEFKGYNKPYAVYIKDIYLNVDEAKKLLNDLDV
jgi:hypothetical protein